MAKPAPAPVVVRYPPADANLKAFLKGFYSRGALAIKLDELRSTQLQSPSQAERTMRIAAILEILKEGE